MKKYLWVTLLIFFSCTVNILYADERSELYSYGPPESAQNSNDPCAGGSSNFYDAIDKKIACIQRLSEACNAGNQEACNALNESNSTADRMGRHADSEMRSQDRRNRMRQSQDAAETRRKMLDKSWIGSDGIERHYDPE